MILMIMTKNSSNNTLDYDSYDYFKNNLMFWNIFILKTNNVQKEYKANCRLQCPTRSYIKY